jgi:hypothetical protein
MFDNERLLRECNRREEQHRRRMRQEVVADEPSRHVAEALPPSNTEPHYTRWHINEAQARREIQAAFSMDLVF